MRWHDLSNAAHKPDKALNQLGSGLMLAATGQLTPGPGAE
jgi:hypothetical protein